MDMVEFSTRQIIDAIEETTVDVGKRKERKEGEEEEEEEKEREEREGREQVRYLLMNYLQRQGINPLTWKDSDDEDDEDYEEE
jgi:hypothetical protein